MKTYLKKSLAIFISVIMLVTSFATPAYAIDESKLSEYQVTSEKVYPLVGGVVEKEIVINNSWGTHRNYIFVIEIAPDNPDVSFVAGYNDGDADEWGCAKVRDQAHAIEKTRDIEVVASINGSFYKTGSGDPDGLLIMNGEVKNPSNSYPFFAVTKDGTPVIRDGYSETDDLQEAVAGYCYLVRDGKAVAPATGELTPRTAIGIRNDGTVVMAVVDGRQDPYSYGVDNDEMAEIMVALGCDVAINLDGGSSSTCLTQREGTDDITLKNEPSNHYERLVSSTIHVYTKAEPTDKFDHITFNEHEYSCACGELAEIDVYAVDKNGFRTEFPKGGYFEVSDESIGTVEGTTFTAGTVTGTATISYVLDGEVLASTEITTYNRDLVAEVLIEILDILNIMRHFVVRLVEEVLERFFGI